MVRANLKFLPALLLILLSGLTPAWATADGGDPTAAPDAPLNERVLTVPGDPDRPATLQVTVYTPSGPGPFPLAVMNHGASDNPKQMPRYRYTMPAYYFLSRGYAVALPMMRGFGESGGAQRPHGCDLAGMGLDNAKDIRAVVRFLATQPGIDGSRVVVAGQSFGGWNTLAFGTLGEPGVKGVISFMGGVTESDCAHLDTSLPTAAGELGKAAKVPSIWFFGDNDKVFATPVWHEMYRRYTEAGGAAELVAYGSFGTDSHAFLSHLDAMPLWVPRLDAFLGRIGLPNAPIHPEYLPVPRPKPSGFAALNDAAAVPYLSDATRQAYRQFLGEAEPRVFVIAPTGSVFLQQGGFDPLGRALEACKKAGQPCRAYAIDHDVVWVPPPAPPPPSHYAAIDDVAAVPYLTDQGRDLYRRFLAHTDHKALVLAPDGAAYAYYGAADPYATAWLSCQDHSAVCQTYAVDNDVVWTRPTPEPPPTRFAPLTDESAIPYIGADGKQGYEKFLTLPRPRAFVIAPDGAWFASMRNADPIAGALAACGKQHQGCRLYAVDNDVVWAAGR